MSADEFLAEGADDGAMDENAIFFSDAREPIIRLARLRVFRVKSDLDDFAFHSFVAAEPSDRGVEKIGDANGDHDARHNKDGDDRVGGLHVVVGQ